MRLLTLLLFIGSFHTSFSQLRSFWVGINGTVQFNTYTKTNGEIAVLRPEVTSIPKWQSFGVTAQMESLGKWSYLIGFNYAFDGFELNHNFITNHPGDPDIPLSTEVMYSYFNIPLEASYKITKDAKLEVFAFGGLNNSFLINTKEESVMMDSSEKETLFFSKNQSSVFMQLKLGLQLRYTFDDLLRVSVNPFLSYRILENTGDSFEKNPFAFGASVALEYGILKKK
ncbi:MAG: hypothetical protein ACI9GM_001122 [Salibacteraceae bacterium]|jgi:hypothetical protein